MRGDIITFKTGLKSILKPENLDLNQQKINDLVILCNEIVKRTYQFIRLYILDRYEKNLSLPIEKNLPLPKLNSAEILNFMKCLGESQKPRGKGPKSETIKKMEEYNQFYENTFKQIVNKPKFNLKNMDHILTYLSIKMETCYNNNIGVHFIKRIRRFMNIKNPYPVKQKDSKEEKSKKRSEFNKVINLILSDKIEEVTEKYKGWAKKFKNKYLPPDFTKVKVKVKDEDKYIDKGLAYALKAETHKFLEYTIKINKAIEDRNEEVKNNPNLTVEQKRKDTKKLFQPLSLRTSNVPHYITLDRVILLQHFGLKGDSYKFIEKGGLEKYNDYIWSLIFDINKKPFKPSKSLFENGYKVSTIETDGVGVSIVFQKKATGSKKVEQSELTDPKYIDEATEEEKQEIKKRKIVSVDPGKGNMIYLWDGENELIYTNQQRRHETRSIIDSIKILMKRQKNNLIASETELSKFNGKTTDLNKAKEYLAKKVEVDNANDGFYEDPYFRKLKHRRYINTQRSEDKLLNEIEKTFGKNIVLAYGDYDSKNYHLPGVPPAIGSGLRKKINKRFPLFLVNEFRTSKLCCRCEKPLENMKVKVKKGKKEKNKKIHRILVCRGCITISGSKSNSSYFINRDRNGTANILKVAKNILETGEKPINFRRKKADEPVKKIKFRVKKKVKKPIDEAQ